MGGWPGSGHTILRGLANGAGGLLKRGLVVPRCSPSVGREAITSLACGCGLVLLWRPPSGLGGGPPSGAGAGACSQDAGGITSGTAISRCCTSKAGTL